MPILIIIVLIIVTIGVILSISIIRKKNFFIFVECNKPIYENTLMIVMFYFIIDFAALTFV